MVRGVVKWFNPDKGFGFIEIKSGEFSGDDIFVHAIDVQGQPLRDDDEVEFSVEEDDRTRGRKYRAARVTGGTGRAGDDRRGDRRSRGRSGGRGGRGGGRGDTRPGDWDCPECGLLVFASRDKCFKCGCAKPRDDSRKRGRKDSRSRSRSVSRSRSRSRSNRR